MVWNSASVTFLKICYVFIMWCWNCGVLLSHSVNSYRNYCKIVALTEDYGTSWKEGRKEGNVLFNDALNTFSYGYMTSDIWYRTTQIARKETRCRHMGYSFWLAAIVFYVHQPKDRIAHTNAFVTPVVEHWMEQEIAQWIHHEGSIRRPIAPWVNRFTWRHKAEVIQQHIKCMVPFSRIAWWWNCKNSTSYKLYKFQPMFKKILLLELRYTWKQKPGGSNVCGNVTKSYSVWAY